MRPMMPCVPQRRCGVLAGTLRMVARGPRPQQRSLGRAHAQGAALGRVRAVGAARMCAGQRPVEGLGHVAERVPWLLHDFQNARREGLLQRAENARLWGNEHFRWGPCALDHLLIPCSDVASLCRPRGCQRSRVCHSTPHLFRAQLAKSG